MREAAFLCRRFIFGCLPHARALANTLAYSFAAKQAKAGGADFF